MKFAIAVAATLLLSSTAHAIVGGGAPSTEGIARSVVTIVGSRGNFCTGAVIAPKIVLTAAHCVQPGADYRIVEYGAGQPTLQNIKNVAIHPGFKMEAMSAHRATADVALLQLEAPAKGKVAAAVGMPNIPITVGGRFTIAGIGVTVRGDGKSGGTIRAAGLVATGKPGTLQIRLVDPAGQGTRDGLGACTGDSGAPAFEDKPNGPVIIGVVSWSTGPNGSCGLRRHDRRDAAHALSRLGPADRAAMGCSPVSLTRPNARRTLVCAGIDRYKISRKCSPV